ncbi:EGF-like domain-containing protein [Caenorhabditis elegans]|uniref:EGF-like domain-containing protein n=2 Tax=Caenorhabditis elegans TaxID=6239 RepID=H2KZX4_CAEEL|nr:EGF-like domain-containing protein [Caenorhabditis elegans]CCD70327.1 EGF-like domain-containing protein [Caenorhabditis elegans]|eukprot:NP_495387.2 Uncharacterized protein CELE_T13C2.6 [Caenorhabditis elegans]
MRTCLTLTGFLLISMATISVGLQPMGAPTRKCDATNSFQCQDGRCIPMSWRCDGDIDCQNEEDEKNCPKVCGAEEHKCGEVKSARSSLERFKCIPNKWVCDGEFDCEDKSDEFQCKNVSCQEKQFQCEELSGDYSLCIPETWVCDGQRDCTNGKDEQNCTSKTSKCPDNNFQCSNGNCIFKNWVCDGEEDCSDGSDELLTAPSNCNRTVNQCPPGEMWKCGSGECIPSRWRCDAEVDCKDHSDEKNCTAIQHTCKLAEEFACKASHNCINKAFVCDGELDCSDGSDEDDCADVRTECKSGERTCPASYGAYGAESGHVVCIPASSWCNGEEDCPDGGDEKECNMTAPVTCQKGTEYECPSTPLQCIEMSKLCASAQFDCGDGNMSVCSQKKIIEMCKPSSEGCVCRPSFVRGNNVCHCKDGYKLENGQCIDINECEIAGVCDQICLNIPGSYRCACHAGYQISFGDTKIGSGRIANKCRAMGGDPLVLLTNRHTIRQFDLVNKMHFPVSSSPGSAVAMDFHILNGTLIWSDVLSKQILKCSIGNVSNAFLGTDMCDKKHEIVLTGDKIHTPDGLAVDWVHDLLFWTDGGLDQINVLDMKNGKQRVLYSSDLEEPRAIAVDPEVGLIFWTDWGKKARIERSGMDGQHRTVIVEGDRVVWPNGLALDYVDKRVYWADAKIKSIFSCDYWGKNIKTVLHSHQYLRHPFSMAVFEDRLFYTDWEHDGVITVNKFTGADIRTVMDQVKSPMTVRIYHKQAQPLMQNKCENSECDHLCLPRAVYREKERVHEKTWHDRPFSCACEGTTASDVLECFADLETKSGISMFTIFLLLCVGGVVAAGFVIVRRKMGPRTFTALNFDNPIYRRTTEEADHQMEDPFRDPFAEPRNGRGRNDGLPTLASADNETRADALSF